MTTLSYTDEELGQLSSVIKFVRNNDNFIAFEVGNQKFNLIMPKDKDSSYFIELPITLKGYEWLSRINEFIFEKNPTLETIMKHIEMKYNDNKKQTTQKDNKFPDIPDCDINMFDLQEQRYRRTLESKLETLKSNITLTTDTNKAKEIFSKKTTANIIMGEFFKLRKRYQDKRIEITLNDDNVYHWKVKFNKFESQNLMTQLEKLKSKYQYTYIELEIHFHDTLYPSYPPFIRVTRPRLENSLMHRITNMRMIQFEFWNPCRGMEFILTKLYHALNNNCVIDADSEMNDLIKYPQGAYHPLESILIKLASLCDTKDDLEPLDKEEYKTTIVQTKKETSNTGTKKTVWSSGVGYGNDHSTQWDPAEYLRLQQEKDQQIQSVLTTIIDNLQNYSENEMYMVYKIIKSSYLIPFVKSYIKGTNMLDMSRHSEMYKLLFTFLQIITTEEGIYLFDEHINPTDSLFSYLKNLYQETKTIAKLVENKKTDTDIIENDEEINTIDAGDFDVCNMVCSIYEMIEPLFNKYLENKNQYEEQEKKKWNDKVENAKSSLEPSHQKYKDIMNDMKFETTKFKSSYYYTSNNSNNRRVMMRLAKEYAGLLKNLPILFQSSIFVRVDEQNNKKVKVLITGPDNTPYDSGCFIFDLYTGDNYPNQNPSMIFKNTGGKRFNPNLYDCGKVCLSLLGTWQGASSEKWIPETSTLEQLFVSVQSQILVEHPYYNEPGYEYTFNTPSGKKNSHHYNLQRRIYTLQHTMLELLQKPDSYPEFTNVIINHFKLKKDYIKKIITKWIDDAKEYENDNTNKAKDFYGNIVEFYETTNTIGKKVIGELDKLN